MDNNTFLSKARLTKMINEVVIAKKLNYIDAVVHVCESNNIEIEDVRRYISPAIKEKIEAEAMRLNFLPKNNMLPID